MWRMALTCAVQGMKICTIALVPICDLSEDNHEHIKCTHESRLFRYCTVLTENSWIWWFQLLSSWRLNVRFLIHVTKWLILHTSINCGNKTTNQLVGPILIDLDCSSRWVLIEIKEKRSYTFVMASLYSKRLAVPHNEGTVVAVILSPPVVICGMLIRIIIQLDELLIRDLTFRCIN